MCYGATNGYKEWTMVYHVTVRGSCSATTCRARMNARQLGAARSPCDLLCHEMILKYLHHTSGGKKTHERRAQAPIGIFQGPEYMTLFYGKGDKDRSIRRSYFLVEELLKILMASQTRALCMRKALLDSAS